ncbi:hypothetical protein GH983_15140 [Agrobacterium sp. MA01]|uniref:hypothetical protein n=1 Tax=Rhizobium/Agrobacterium group TaxID=227290 RepID=UPI00129BFBE3|nr:hypothetical protein [Agrobacterium sp. MA01]QGG91732.1 hypothetical protein GH983_15140 [Agrobacterium sp. MA01]
MKPDASAEPKSVNIDSQNRHIAQQAGLDQDLESQVPPRYGPFTVTTLGVILVLLFAAVVWIML